MKRVIGRAMAWALLVGIAVTPLIVLAVEALAWRIHTGETFAGCAVGSLFFAVTALATLVFLDSPGLRFAVLSTYVVKTVVLIGLGLTVPFGGVNRPALGIAVVVSAFTYLITQSVLVSRGERRFRLGPRRKY